MGRNAKRRTELTDRELLADAWSQLHDSPKGDPYRDGFFSPHKGIQRS